MTVTGFLIGLLAGIGVLSIVLIAFLVLFARRMDGLTEKGENPAARFFEGKGFASFQSQVHEKLSNAGYNSFVAAELPFPAVEVRIEVAGRANNTPTYRMTIRMGYRREDHLALVETALSPHGLTFERIDSGKGMIKLRSEKLDDVERFIDIAKSVKTAVMFDLADSQITVNQTLRQA
ncbi:MAG: hypothetical protein QNJ20_10935 [Paracoccaceae bacterium]|nr:hypothetical protein [Paracoccaceae bacterium]